MLSPFTTNVAPSTIETWDASSTVPPVVIYFEPAPSENLPPVEFNTDEFSDELLTLSSPVDVIFTVPPVILLFASFKTNFESSMFVVPPDWLNLALLLWVDI